MRLSPYSSVLMLVAACSTSGNSANAPAPNCDDHIVQNGGAPSNPFLADSGYPLPHLDSAQQDSSSVRGPEGPTKTLSESEIHYQHLGAGHFGAYLSGQYEDCRRVYWSNGADRIAKIDHTTFEVLAEFPLERYPIASIEEMEEDLAILDALDCSDGVDSPDCVTLRAHALQMASTYLLGLDGVYAMVDVDNTFYVGGSSGVVAYGDAIEGDPRSEIVVKRVWEVPDDGSVPGNLVGFNMTHDGRIILVTDLGALVALRRDFSAYESIMLPFSEEAPAYNEMVAEMGLRGFNWVRNPAAIDEAGGIYIASADHLSRVVWTGEALSLDEGDGAWTVQYSNSRGFGTGATPSLIGFEEGEDRFVVITDGDVLMNMTYFWREDIPADWQQIPGTLSRRVAGKLPVTFGIEGLEAAQSEQSVVVAGYGAVAVNNEPRNVPASAPTQAIRLYASYLGNEPLFQPFGVQKFEWNPETRTLEEAWANPELSSPNAVPFISRSSNLVYTIGARDGGWTLEGIDFTTGESAFHYVLGSARYNSLFAGTTLDQEGRVVYGNPFGKTRIEVN